MKESRSFKQSSPSRNFADKNDSDVFYAEPLFRPSAQHEKPNASRIPVQLKQNKNNKSFYDFHKESDTSNLSSTAKLPESIQFKMESAFNTDFSNLSIQKNSAEAKNLGAQAFARGNNIHFAPGLFNPNTHAGQELIGHELTHVVQQRQGRVQPTNEISGRGVNADQSLENEADQLGKQAASGKNVNKQSQKFSGTNARTDIIQGFGLPDLEDLVSKPASLANTGIKYSKSVIGTVDSVVGSVANIAKNKVTDAAGYGKNIATGAAETIGGTVGRIGQGASGALDVIPKILRFAKSVTNAVGSLLADPTGFLKNILKAIKNGFGQFFGNISKHLFSGLVQWLAGKFGDLGIELPESFDVQSILGIISQIISITWKKIKVKITQLMGPMIVEFGEKGWEMIKLLLEGGPRAIFGYISKLLGKSAAAIKSSGNSMKVKVQDKFGSFF